MLAQVGALRALGDLGGPMAEMDRGGCTAAHIAAQHDGTNAFSSPIQGRVDKNLTKLYQPKDLPRTRHRHYNSSVALVETARSRQA